MSRCKANPCCSDPYNCEVPLPQHASGLVHLNDRQPLSSLKKAAELRQRRRAEQVIVTEDMVERAYEAFVAACEWSDWDEPEVRGYLRTVLTAALILPTHKPLQEEG